MKNQALFSSKDKNKKLKCRLLQFLFSKVTTSRSVLLVPRQGHNYTNVQIYIISLKAGAPAKKKKKSKFSYFRVDPNVDGLRCPEKHT